MLFGLARDVCQAEAQNLVVECKLLCGLAYELKLEPETSHGLESISGKPRCLADDQRCSERTVVPVGSLILEEVIVQCSCASQSQKESRLTAFSLWINKNMVVLVEKQVVCSETPHG